MENELVKKLIEAVFAAPPELQEKALGVLRGVTPVHATAAVPEPSLKTMPGPLLLVSEIEAVSRIQPLHETRQIPARRLNQEVIVIRH